MIYCRPKLLKRTRSNSENAEILFNCFFILNYEPRKRTAESGQHQTITQYSQQALKSQRRQFQLHKHKRKHKGQSKTTSEFTLQSNLKHKLLSSPRPIAIYAHKINVTVHLNHNNSRSVFSTGVRRNPRVPRASAKGSTAGQ